MGDEIIVPTLLSAFPIKQLADAVSVPSQVREIALEV